MNIITKLYAQTDQRWAGQLLGFNTDARYSIANYGCVVTSIGNMLYAITGNPMYTPQYINDWGKAHSGFLPGGGLAIWGAYLNLGHIMSYGETADLNRLNQWLQSPENYAIVEFQMRGYQHFCLAPYVGKIIDSEDGKLKSIGTYPFLSAKLFSSTDQPAAETVAAPAAEPQPDPTRGTVTVTGKPWLNLRQRPSTKAPLAIGFDGGGNPISKLMPGVQVDYVDVVPADPDSPYQGNFLKSIRGNYFAAEFTNYNSLSNRLARLKKGA